MGFVQLDTIQVVARAHHHILWSRNQNYREPMLDKLLRDERKVFEHFTHDASVIPMEFYPFWTRQFERLEKQTRRWGWHEALPNMNELKKRIQSEGPLSTKAFDTKITGQKKMWSRPPHKLALDYLWYSGELTTSHRENFTKFYGLAKSVIPHHFISQTVADKEQIAWLCRNALDRLAFASEGEIQRFWDAVDLSEVKKWSAKSSSSLMPVSVEGKDGIWRDVYAPIDIETRIENLSSTNNRLRIINPFDPAIRDRKRLKYLFGFDYTIEMFVPAKKRQWGYYVYPLLEGDRFIGRIEIKADRKSNALRILNLWSESNLKWSKSRTQRLNAELNRIARFIGISNVENFDSNTINLLYPK
ncbi:winged helix-turn-helix domain-containing protein [Hirschia maritima]|uniref:winged helix-turn-helix domain-containing protein n=1 Tax=Hirschia maritima TaxID=1121961 RepID=UPI000366D39F|nr:crosslink repair DNA glycosylase YcaQ family protein [Hirschia maritima]